TTGVTGACVPTCGLAVLGLKAWPHRLVEASPTFGAAATTGFAGAGAAICELALAGWKAWVLSAPRFGATALSGLVEARAPNGAATRGSIRGALRGVGAMCPDEASPCVFEGMPGL